jgi:hypothetical protein
MKLTGVKPSVTRRDDIDDDDGELGKAEEGKIEHEREKETRDEGRPVPLLNKVELRAASDDD